MRQTAIVVAVVLALAFALQWIVAWTCSTRGAGAGFMSSTTTEADHDWWKDRAPAGFGPSPMVVERGGAFGVDVTVMWDAGSAPRNAGGNRIWELRAGWPARSLSCVYRHDASAGSMTSSGGLLTGSSSPLPVRIHPVQAAANTLAMAAIIMGFAWLVTRARAVVRRVHRRDGCPACGYPTGASPVCTECGHARNGDTAAPRARRTWRTSVSRELVRVFAVIGATTVTGVLMGMASEVVWAVRLGNPIVGDLIWLGAAGGWLANAVTVPLLWRRPLVMSGLTVYPTAIAASGVAALVIGGEAAVCAGGAVLAVMSLVAWRRYPLVFPERPAGLCQACGYRLRGLRSTVCPECGGALPSDTR